MHREHTLTNLSERCRICLADDGSMSEIFDESLQEKIKDLSKCTSVDIKDEQDLPRVICHVCLYKLELWSEFKEEFLKSNKLLLEHVRHSETADNMVSPTKRKHSEVQGSGEDNLSGDDKKRARAELSPKIVDANTPEAKKDDVKEECISEDGPASSKDSCQKDSSILNSSVQKEVGDQSTDNLQAKPLADPAKIKPLGGRRGKNTERRMASTKRWVERKKALIAATGENVSDSDSIASDEVQLSPIQKARAKTNAEKEVEKQKRIARALKNLEANMAGQYGIKHERDSFLFGDSDSDSRTTRSQKLASNDVTKNTEKASKEKATEDNAVKSGASPQTSKENEVSVAVNEKTAKTTAEKDKKEIEKPFKPHIVKTELNVGDATYIVTSTLVLAEPSQSTKVSANNDTEIVKNAASDENTQDKNTDIIDAVQLRRIHPIPSVANEKKNIERCLNIEVEGTELEPLKQVQLKLADFLEEEMRYRLFGLKNVKKRRGRKPAKERISTLNIQLKGIVEKAIKRNFETSMMNIPFIIPAAGTVSPAFVELAERSSKFQPKVLLHRLDITEESRRYRIGSMLQGTESKDFNSTVYPMSRKRKHLLPARYNEYVTSGLDSDSDAMREKRQAKVFARNNTTISKPSTARRTQAIVNDENNETEETDIVICEVVECDTTTTPNINNSIDVNNLKPVNRMVLDVIDQKSNEAHRCNICQKSFTTLAELEIHNSATHKTDNSPVKQNKQKLMRCKRCHEIVEARLVKQHVCRTTKHAHKCYVCNSTFRTEKLLARHLKSHDQSEFKIDVTKIETGKASNMSLQEKNVSLVATKAEDQTKIGVDKETNVNNVNFKKETYTCFVCNKTFTDEEVLKDHLQKHCDDISEGEESTGKEQYQCAICGESMDSEDALEEHVEKHLFNDEDDNPNLISISGETEKAEVMYTCAQCSEVFNSEMLLEMHMQAHEEEAAIAEWERQGMKTYEYQCMICDEVFGTEEDLSDHLDVHNGNVHVCQLCDKPFQSLEDLQNHVATH